MMGTQAMGTLPTVCPPGPKASPKKTMLAMIEHTVQHRFKHQWDASDKQIQSTKARPYNPQNPKDSLTTSKVRAASLVGLNVVLILLLIIVKVKDLVKCLGDTF